MKFFLWLCSFLMMCGSVLQAQELRIKHIHADEYPTVKVEIELSPRYCVNFKELQVIENEESNFFSIDSISAEENRTIICYLLDEKLLHKTNSKQLIISTLQELSKKHKLSDLVNLLVAKSLQNEGQCIQLFSYEFSTDASGFSKHISNCLNQYTLQKGVGSLSCPIEQALKFFNSKNLPFGKKKLICITAEELKESESWELLKEKANANLIELSYLKVEAQTAETNPVDLQNELLNQFDSILSIGKEFAKEQSRAYMLAFTSIQDNKINTFEIRYQDEVIAGSYTRPGYISFIKANAPFLIVIVGLAVICLILAYRIRKHNNTSVKKKKSKKRQDDEKDEIPFDPKKTLYGSAEIAPFVTVELAGGIEKHELKKLRTTIGRHSDNDILIANLTISNHHAIITNEGGVFYIQDNESTNGTFVNEIKITKVELKPGDSVRLGKAKLVLNI